MLDLASLKLFLPSNLDEVNFEGTWWDVSYLIGKRSEFLAIRYELKHLAIKFIQELVNFGCLGDLWGQL